MKPLLLFTAFTLTACAGRTPQPVFLPNDQYVLPVKPGDVITIHSAAQGSTSNDVSRGAQGSTGPTRINGVTYTDTARTRAAAPSAAGDGYDALLLSYPYPYEVHYYDFRSEDQALRMAYMDEAPARPNGKVVLLLHGMNFVSAYWGRTIRALVDRGFRVIAPDQVGFGKSSKPVRYQFSFAALCDNTRRLLDSLGVHKATIVGHSMGGMMAVRCAIQRPELVDRLVLVNPLGLEDWSETVPYQRIDDTYHKNLTQTAGDLVGTMRANYFGGNWSPAYDDLVDPLLGMLRGPDRARVAWDRALEEDMIFTQPVVHDLRLLTPVTLLLIGQHDRTAIGRDRVGDIEAARLGDYPTMGRNAKKVIPNSRLVELPLAGHVPMVDSFDDYIHAVEDFLGAR